ncbi:hypothetical protein [Nonomuraea sp. NPDC050643]|uniref:hypothetical protein n=1 Tax=Nonomuraea sp. NPDC050643 TaxID=3155660 RepID=UPI0034065C77
MALLHTVGCVLALVPALLPAAGPTRRWPHVVMALGMAAGHLGGSFFLAGVRALPAAGWLCGSPSRRAESGHHIPDLVVMSILLVLAALGGPPAGHAHAGGPLATVGLVIGSVWTCARLIRVLPARDGKRRMIGQDLCSAGMAVSMAFMATLPW